MDTIAERRAFEEYGFTNDLAHLERIKTYRDAAVADGWSIEPTYGAHESVDRASKLHKGGFVMMVLTREKTGKWLVEAHVNIWGPDGGAIKPPELYDWQKIQEGVHICDNCGKRVEQTNHYAFAGRACDECLPAMKKKYEYPGWCD